MRVLHEAAAALSPLPLLSTHHSHPHSTNTSIFAGLLPFTTHLSSTQLHTMIGNTKSGGAAVATPAAPAAEVCTVTDINNSESGSENLTDPGRGDSE